jgi:tetratricopeptide (TPR) repeat protein
VTGALTLGACVAAFAITEWKTVISGSPTENALYRWMPMAAERVFGPRPPHEAIPLLGELIQKQPSAELYSLRAMNEESALDFSAAEADWKKRADLAKDRTAAQLDLADFYHRRLRPQDEITALSAVANASPFSKDKLLPVNQQQSWVAFERILKVAHENALAVSDYDNNYRAWIARYPDQEAVYTRYFQFLLDSVRFDDADKLVAQYRSAFPRDDIFPVKARALLAYKRGSVPQGLQVYEQNFQPLWPQELVDSYFDLLTQTGSLRKFLDQAKAALERNPDDLNAAARVFYYYQHQGRSDAAQQTLAEYRHRKEERNAKWSNEELYTLARLSEQTHSYPEAARYYYALYSNDRDGKSQERALAGLASVLLDAPEQDVRLGAGDLSMYKDIGTMDPGPGFLNGILSLILNSTSPASKYAEEEQRAVPYFHRAEGAELIRLLDAQFPKSELRAGLHARLLETYSNYSQSEAVIRDGKQFLNTFIDDPQREQVALLMANAYQRTNRPEEEFSLYDSLLAELAKKADNVPLGVQSEGTQYAAPAEQPNESTDEQTEVDEEQNASAQPPQGQGQRAFQVGNNAQQAPSPAMRSPEYSRVLERYLARLVSLNQLPQALSVLRKEIDRNPNDPGLYERLAEFLGQNRLGAQQEQVYQRAIQQFQDATWYHKLARFYLREKRDSDFQKLTEQVVNIFAGTELDHYFREEVYRRGRGPDFYFDLNRYANARFPHDLVFVRNLLGETRSYCSDAWFQIIEQHWWEAEDLRNGYFDCLARSGRLETALETLKQAQGAVNSTKDVAANNPVATRFIGEAEMWRCHFEQSAEPMGALAREFPADSDIGKRAASLYRSLAAFSPEDTDRAIAIEENLYQADPTDRDQLAHIGDVLADRELFARAGPYWERMATVRPREPQAYLDPATVYWDYYDFNDALRLLNEGRTKLQNPALYRYEEGAIYENQRDYAKAIGEYVHGALQGKDDRARNRLLELARRPKLRDLVENATVSLVGGDTSDLESLKLRVEILDAQNRPKDVEQLLSSLVAHTSSLELLEWMEQMAQQKSFVAVQEAVLEREAVVTSDPVRRLELRYSLVRFYEQKKDLAAAQHNIEALYSDNPKIMGVVRSTVDFYWRNQQRQRAIDVLLQAAKDSYPDLRTRFEFEVARKETDAGQYEKAQALLASLLKASPYNDEYLAAMADTYARSGNDQGLKSFYLSHIDTFKSAPLSQEQRNREIAALRRGIIPALTRLKDYSGAVDQYIEIINKYPEDEALVSEAALYAQKYRLDQKLVDFYSNTVKQSPRDFRWPMVLARTYTQLEKFPEAIDAYAASVRVRPDRTDLRVARAELLERLMRFDEATDEYRQLFDLNYHDTQWMDKIATVRARQGKIPETVSALEAALVTNRPEKAENYFEVARRLESWNMLPQARDFAQKGVDTAGRDLLAVSEHQAGAQLYVRIMTRLRQQEQAYQRLQQALSDADSLAADVKVAAEQAQKNGIVSVTDRQWREAAFAARREAARSGMALSMREMGTTVARYFTPEEKSSFVAALESKGANVGDDDLSDFYLSAAQAADAPELEARWLRRLLMSHYSVSRGRGFEARLVDLETRRLHLDGLGTFLEEYARTLRLQEGRDMVLMQAAHAYRECGEYNKELPTLTQVGFRLGGEDLQRLFALLLERQPDVLIAAIERGNNISDQAANYVLAHGDESMAMKAVAARGKSLVPVWTKSYDALTGLYFDDRSPSTQLVFLSALGDANIGERVSKPVDRSQQLAGNIWFYYGSRYGAWLGSSNSADPEQFLPAILEQSPASPEGYVVTAEYYSENGNADRAIDDYRRALELVPSSLDVHDRIAVLYWKQQKRSDAITEWKSALQLLDEQVRLRSVPPQFWAAFTNVLNHLASRKLMPELHPQADAVLRDYVRKNGSYSVTQLLRAGFDATNDSAAGTTWMLQLAAVAPDPNSVLNILARAAWIPVNAKEPIYKQMISRLEDRVRANEGLEKDYAQQELRRWQLIYVRYLIGQKRFDAAAELLDSLPKPEALSANELELRLRIAIARNQVDSILDQYRALPEQAPSAETLRSAATAIQHAGMRGPARKIFEYLFAQEIAAHNLTAANLLGLAEIRLEDGDTSGAMELLRRLTLVVRQPFENLEPAASLLARTGHHAEAAEFFAQLVKAKPWDVEARLQLAQQQIAAGKDASDARQSALTIAKDVKSTYAERVRAAEMLSNESASLGSAELDWLAHAATGSADTADKPFFYLARMKAAEKANSEIRIRLLRNAMEQSQDSESARVPLFFAFAAAGQDRLAVSTLQPWLNTGFLENATQPSRRVIDAQQATEQTEEDSQEPEDAAAVPAPAPLSHAERIRIAVTLAGAYLKLQEVNSAHQYYSLAARLETSKSLKAELIKKRDEVAAILDRNRANELRAPTIHKELDQDHLVRPKLTEAASQNGSSKGGAL